MCAASVCLEALAAPINELKCRQCGDTFVQFLVNFGDDLIQFALNIVQLSELLLVCDWALFHEYKVLIDQKKWFDIFIAMCLSLWNY